MGQLHDTGGCSWPPQHQEELRLQGHSRDFHSPKSSARHTSRVPLHILCGLAGCLSTNTMPSFPHQVSQQGTKHGVVGQTGEVFKPFVIPLDSCQGNLVDLTLFSSVCSLWFSFGNCSIRRATSGSPISGSESAQLWSNDGAGVLGGVQGSLMTSTPSPAAKGEAAGESAGVMVTTSTGLLLESDVFSLPVSFGHGPPSPGKL